MCCRYLRHHSVFIYVRFSPSAHRFVFCGGVDFLSLAVSVLLTSLLLLDNPTDVILELIKKTLLLTVSQRDVSRSGVLDGDEVNKDMSHHT